MFGVILCTHSTFAEGLKNAIEMIAGKQEDFETICFMNGEDPDDVSKEMDEIISKFKNKGIPTV